MTTIKPGTKGWNVKSVIELPGKDIRGKVSIKPEKFDDLVYKQGVRVRVYRSSYCPRVKSIDGAEHDIDCPICKGTGFLDRYPIETYAFIQGQTMEKQHFAEGMYDGNAVQATFMQGIELQYFTLVELMDFTDLFFERVKRQAGVMDVLRYPATRVNMLVDANGSDYFEGSDFRLDANGCIIWCPGGRQPAKGVIYSVNYEMTVMFRALKAAHVNRFVQASDAGTTKMVKMNEQWTLQKAYLIERKNQDGHPISPNKIRDSDDELGAQPVDIERL